jgi:hypothetical protein
LIERLRDRDERPLARLALGSREQRLDALQRSFKMRRRILGEQRRVQGSLELVGDEPGVVLERLVAAGEVDRGSCETFFGRAAPDDRRHARQGRLELRPDPAAVHDQRTSSPERQIVAPPARDPDCGAELGRTVVAGRPPLDTIGAGAAADRFDHPDHCRRQVVGRRQGECEVVLEAVTPGILGTNRKFDDVRGRGHDDVD